MERNRYLWKWDHCYAHCPLFCSPYITNIFPPQWKHTHAIVSSGYRTHLEHQNFHGHTGENTARWFFHEKGKEIQKLWSKKAKTNQPFFPSPAHTQVPFTWVYLGVGPKPSCLHWIFRSPNFMTRRNRKHISLNHFSLSPSHRREEGQTKHCEGFPANSLSGIRTLSSAFLPVSRCLGSSSFRWITESKHGCTLGTSFSLHDVAW